MNWIKPGFPFHHETDIDKNMKGKSSRLMVEFPAHSFHLYSKIEKQKSMLMRTTMVWVEDELLWVCDWRGMPDHLPWWSVRYSTCILPLSIPSFSSRSRPKGTSFLCYLQCTLQILVKELTPERKQLLGQRYWDLFILSPFSFEFVSVLDTALWLVSDRRNWLDKTGTVVTCIMNQHIWIMAFGSVTRYIS